MDLCNLIDDPFDFIECQGQFPPSETMADGNLDDELNDILLNRAPSISQTQPSLLRPIDLPSHRKHYGLLTFYRYRIPILFRLSNNYYVPYIRFSYALNVLDQHQSNRISPILDMVKNLPILEMTSIETVYYDRVINSLSASIDIIPENHPEWSNRLLSVALLDCLLGILDCSTSFFQTNYINTEKWEQILETMRQEVKSRWTIEEKLVINQIEKQSRQSNNELDSLCVSSTNIAQRRLFFEKRLDLSIVDESGGFVQLDSYIFPYIKCLKTNRIYINLNDIHSRYHQYLLLPSYYIHRFPSNSSQAHSYSIISEQARENYFWNSIHGTVYMAKRLPNPASQDFELKFLSLDIFLKAKGMCFVQLFEKSSLDYLTTTYKNQFGRQFVIGDSSRQCGFIDDDLPYIRTGKQEALCRTWIPAESVSERLMTHDERLFINCMLLYHNRWKMILNRCIRSSRAVCKCCKKEFCLEHLWQHMNSIDSQLNPLKVEVEEINSQLKTLDIESIITNFRQQMLQWRVDSYTTIDRLSEDKCQEFNRHIYEKFNQHRQEIDQLQSRIDELIVTHDGNDQDIDLIKWKIDDLKDNIRKVKRYMIPTILMLPLILDKQLIRIKD
ncbi:unnamed protein product [Adineta ricciae]|uniref:Uncharacterized protein n=1 Tax=Adineta ricciae TaxID=249248 RepID=A0A815C4M3_ADIRI|nr:unnamed protein product [Adineta ricciae]CAF1278106.1 unnamed protein product [Adineta ricciae]